MYIVGLVFRCAANQPQMRALYFMKTFSDSFRKNFYACLIGPLSVIPATVIYALAFKIIEPEANTTNFDLVPFLVFVTLVIAYPITILFGLPISLVLQKTEKFNFLNLMLVTLFSVLLYAFLTDAQSVEIYLIIYYSCFVATGCYFLHRIG